MAPSTCHMEGNRTAVISTDFAGRRKGTKDTLKDTAP